ncbi:MAG TPA: hypothetical protein VF857_04505 [Spirochaetota bacterium]
MKKMTWFIVLGFVACVSMSVRAEEMIRTVQGSYTESAGLALLSEIGKSDASEKDLYSGIVYHNLAGINPAKKEEYVTRSISLLEKYKDQNALGCAYLGSAITVMGSVNAAKNKMLAALKNLEEGSALIDAAVGKEPANISIRMLRIQNAVGVSKGSPLKRWAVARTDINYLKEKESALPADFRSALYYNSGEVNIGEKKTAAALVDYNLSIKASPNSPSAALSRKSLAKYSE